MAAPEVFVSHSHKDDAFTDRLVKDFRQAGANAWMDKNDLGAGDFQDRISQALSDCEWFVLVLTKDALESKWVRQEVNVANILHHQGQIQNLIFIQAGPVEHTEIPAFWRVFNIFDATKDYDSARDRALKAVGLSGLTRTGQAQPATVKDWEHEILRQQSIVEQASQIAEWVPELQAQARQLAEIDSARLPKRLADLGFTAHSDNGVEYILPPLCTVPAGPFLMGSDPKRDLAAAKESLAVREQPQHTVTLPAYEIARFPVTVAEYACFVRAGQPEPKRYEDLGAIVDWHKQLRRLDHPVVCVTWHDAIAYAAWLSQRTGELWRLPTEAEWEKAARGTDGRIYPWGDTFDTSRCSTSESGIDTTTQLGIHASDASLYGVQDTAGNVWEWTGSLFFPYPYITSGERENGKSTESRVLRGGSREDGPELARAACRLVLSPYSCNNYDGFRLVRAAPNS